MISLPDEAKHSLRLHFEVLAKTGGPKIEPRLKDEILEWVKNNQVK